MREMLLFAQIIQFIVAFANLSQWWAMNRLKEEAWAEIRWLGIAMVIPVFSSFFSVHRIFHDLQAAALPVDNAAYPFFEKVEGVPRVAHVSLSVLLLLASAISIAMSLRTRRRRMRSDESSR